MEFLKNILERIKTPRAEGGPVVEIFLEPELEELVSEPDKLKEWHEAVARLGLDGQKKIAAPEKSPIPFPIINQQMRLVYSTLCPAHEELKKFSDTAIPLRVLQVAELCQRESYFGELHVWHNNQEKDPILVGVKQDPELSWRKTEYIVARWGDELRSFAELKTLAIARFKEDKAAKLSRAIKGMTAELQAVDELTVQHFNGDSAFQYYPV